MRRLKKHALRKSPKNRFAFFFIDLYKNFKLTFSEKAMEDFKKKLGKVIKVFLKKRKIKRADILVNGKKKKKNLKKKKTKRVNMVVNAIKILHKMKEKIIYV